MKISVITITCRSNPRLVEMAKCLRATFDKAPELEAEWILVDELFDQRSSDAMKVVDDAWQPRELKHFPPPATVHRTGNDKAVAHNTARNAGLVDATGEYVVFLNDCNMVTEGLAALVRDAAAKGLGLKVKMQTLVDMAIPDNGLIRKGHHDLLRPVPVLAAASACWGAPKTAFDQIHGFDLAYDGERYGNDLDAIVRLSRVGISFVSSERAYTLQLRRTKVDKEITTRKDVYAGTRNKQLFAQLQHDKARILPVWEFGQPEPVAKVEEPVVVVRAPRAAPPPRIVQCPAPRPGQATSAGNNPRPIQARARPLAAPVKPAQPIDKALRRPPMRASSVLENQPPGVDDELDESTNGVSDFDLTQLEGDVGDSALEDDLGLE